MITNTIDIDQLLDRRLSPLRIAGLLALGGAGLVQCVMLTVLLATEPEPLPTDTTAALGSIAVAGLAWAVFAGWRLAYREALLLKGRVVSSAMATAFTLIAAIGGTAVAWGRDRESAAVAIGVGGLSLGAAACALLLRNLSAYRAAEARLAQLQTAAGER